MWYVLLNPNAGSGNAEDLWLPQQKELEARGFAFQRVDVPDEKSVPGQVSEWTAKGARKWIAIGGDGTFHHLVNGIMNQEVCAPEEITCAFWSAGTGNDWRRQYQLPSQAEAWREMFIRQQIIQQDVGLIEAIDLEGNATRRYFLNVAGLGYDAFVVKYLDEHEVNSGGGFKYFSSIFRCLANYTPGSLRIITPDQEWEDSFYTLNAGICRYNGGGMRFVPRANPQDGQLELTMLPKVPAWRVAMNVPWAYTPFFDRHHLVRHARSSWVRYEHTGEQPVLIEADGELIGTTPARISVVPGALRFVGK